MTPCMDAELAPVLPEPMVTQGFGMFCGHWMREPPVNSVGSSELNACPTRRAPEGTVMPVKDSQLLPCGRTTSTPFADERAALSAAVSSVEPSHAAPYHCVKSLGDMRRVPR